MNTNTSVATPSIATSLGPLVVMEYEATERFRSIALHTAVAHLDGRLVAVTGPAHDQDSLIYAQLFASSPRLLAACEKARYIAKGS